MGRIFGVVTLVGCASGAEPELGDGNYDRIFGGELVEGSIYDTVFALHRGSWMFCSGTLIAPRVVLTAAHCVDRWPSSPIRVDNATISEELDASEGIGVARVVVHPEWDPSTLVHDLAVLVLERDAMDATGGRLVRPSSNVGWDHVGLEGGLLLAGYGQSGDPDLPDVGVRLAVQHTLEGFATLPDHATAFWNYWLQTEDGAVCFGDSGGPAFVFHDAKGNAVPAAVGADPVPAGGSVELASVHSSVSDVSCTAGDAYGAAVDIDYDFLAPYLADINGSGLVEQADLDRVLLRWGTDDVRADLDGDGSVDQDDLDLVRDYWGVVPD
jgi:hypothetical protein